MGPKACTEPQCLYSTDKPLLPLRTVQPVQSLSACTTVHFTPLYILRNIVDAPLYVSNANLHRYLQMQTVPNATVNFPKTHEERSHHRHVNVEAIQLLDNSEMV